MAVDDREQLLRFTRRVDIGAAPAGGTTNPFTMASVHPFFGKIAVLLLAVIRLVR